MKPNCPECRERIQINATRCPHCQASIDPNDYMPAFKEARDKRSGQINRAKKYTVRAVLVFGLIIATLATVAAWDAYRIMEACYRYQMKNWECDREQAVESFNHRTKVLYTQTGDDHLTPPDVWSWFWTIFTLKQWPIIYAGERVSGNDVASQGLDEEFGDFGTMSDFTRWHELTSALEAVKKAKDRGESFPPPPSFWRIEAPIPERAWRAAKMIREQLRPYIQENHPILIETNN
jgi:hypothetical protein